MNNPYSPPKSKSRLQSSSSNAKTVGLIVSTIGILSIIYGATAFWLIQELPPNGGSLGRLPSMLVMGIGIVITIVGMAVSSIGNRSNLSSTSPKKIPAIYGFAAIGLILLIFILIIAAM